MESFIYNFQIKIIAIEGLSSQNLQVSELALLIMLYFLLSVCYMVTFTLSLKGERTIS